MAITNVGAKALAEALKANKTLTYLSLGMNEIMETQALHLINADGSTPPGDTGG